MPKATPYWDSARKAYHLKCVPVHDFAAFGSRHRDRPRVLDPRRKDMCFRRPASAMPPLPGLRRRRRARHTFDGPTARPRTWGETDTANLRAPTPRSWGAARLVAREVGNGVVEIDRNPG